MAAIPFKIELNEKGAIEVSPPTTRHAFLQSFVSHELRLQRPDGTTFTECPVETDIGVRVPDVVWASPEFMPFQTFSPPDAEIPAFRDVIFPRLRAAGLR